MSGDRSTLTRLTDSLHCILSLSCTTMPTPIPEHVTAAVDVFCRKSEVPRGGYVQSIT